MKLTTKQRKRWTKYINLLKTHLPADKPVVIRTQPRLSYEGKAVLGTMENTAKKYIILINREATWDEKVDILIHEYAHVLDHEGVKAGVIKQRPHGPSWGLRYQECYELLFDREDE